MSGYCSECGTKMNEGARFCGNCGKELRNCDKGVQKKSHIEFRNSFLMGKGNYTFFMKYNYGCINK